VTIDDRQREAEHIDSCWAGCAEDCDDCSNPLCDGDCLKEAPRGLPNLVTVYGFQDRGLL
jgi:hypothetical protein